MSEEAILKWVHSNGINAKHAPTAFISLRAHHADCLFEEKDHAYYLDIVVDKEMYLSTYTGVALRI